MELKVTGYEVKPIDVMETKNLRVQPEGVSL
jgi:hypothetical protein